mmetsp:Transcript_7115/g.17081  ORF Transcript_7115/g.17081 Transcript_7115/m.17081 type:complete len:232 (+) Transcript_7115:3888-4583(+)
MSTPAGSTSADPRLLLGKSPEEMRIPPATGPQRRNRGRRRERTRVVQDLAARVGAAAGGWEGLRSPVGDRHLQRVPGKGRAWPKPRVSIDWTMLVMYFWSRGARSRASLGGSAECSRALVAQTHGRTGVLAAPADGVGRTQLHPRQPCMLRPCRGVVMLPHCGWEICGRVGGGIGGDTERAPGVIQGPRCRMELASWEHWKLYRGCGSAVRARPSVLGTCTAAESGRATCH